MTATPGLVPPSKEAKVNRPFRDVHWCPAIVPAPPIVSSWDWNVCASTTTTCAGDVRTPIVSNLSFCARRSVSGRPGASTSVQGVVRFQVEQEQRVPAHEQNTSCDSARGGPLQ
jgi:hypothetical protein